MRMSPRIRAKICMFSSIMKVFGIFDQEEHIQITNQVMKKRNGTKG